MQRQGMGGHTVYLFLQNRNNLRVSLCKHTQRDSPVRTQRQFAMLVPAHRTVTTQSKGGSKQPLDQGFPLPHPDAVLRKQRGMILNQGNIGCGAADIHNDGRSLTCQRTASQCGSCRAG